MKELEDYNWFPAIFRNFQMEFIGFVVAHFNVYDVFVQYLKTLSLSTQSMTDLCSGSGEPAISIYRKSNLFSSLSLSDKYANKIQLNDDKIACEMKRTDVLEMEFLHGTCYTMFNAFHHFSDEEKINIVQKMKVSGSDAFIVEILEPKLLCLLKVFFTTTIGTLVLTPFIRPFSFLRIFYTYILPINIIAISYDGIVSVFKSRTVKQYQQLFANTDNAIKIFRLKSRLNNLVVIQIVPAK